MNRVAQAIVTQRQNIADRLSAGLVTQERIDALHKELDMGLQEFCEFQQLKSGLMGIMLTLDEAQLIYRYLGNDPSHFNSQPIEVKVVLTKIYEELLSYHVAQEPC